MLLNSTGKRRNYFFVSMLIVAVLSLWFLFTTVITAAPQIYEAESATLSGGAVVATDHTGYTGTGFVGGYTDPNKGNASTQFNVTASPAGSYTTALRYSNGTGATKTLSLYVNGIKIKQISLPATANWDTWTTQVETVTLNSGSNTIRYKFDTTDSGNVNLDNITLNVSLGTNLALSKPITANNTYPGYPATNANDGNVSSYWEGAANSYPNTLTVDLGSSQNIGTVVFKLPVAWGTRTQTLSVLRSTDNVTYNTIVSSTAYTFNPASNNTVTISFSSTTARYVRLNFTANTGSTGGQVAEFEVYAAAGGPTPTPTPSGLYEAELGTLSGGAVVATDHTGYTGTGFVGGYIDANKGNACTQFNVTAASAGNYTTTLRYSNGTGATQTLSLYVNGIKIKQISLPATANWDTWTTQVETVTLNSGSNTITYKYDTTDSGNANLDNITLSYAGPTPTPTPTPTPGPTPTPVPGGSYVEYEAENGTYTGTLRGPGTTYRTVESESSGRKYVNLDATGEYVQWTLSQPANAIVIRYNMPDAPGGGGTTASLSIYVDGVHNQDISLTSKYAWVYGGYPWDNNPAGGNGHRFYDETRLMLGSTLDAGTVIKLQKDSGDTAAYYNIDLIDMENVGPALPQPANSLSITSYGAVPNDANDDTAALNSVISAAISQGKSVWLPSGTFILNFRPNSFSGVTIYGAGMWYTVLSGVGASFSPNGNNCKFYDFAMFGNTTQRIDSAPETGFDGNLGTGSVIQNIWMEHLKVGVWANYGTDGLLINGCRIRNTFADGVNLYNGTRNSTVQNSSFRNTGDDSIAIWSGSGNACTGNTIQYNTVQSPYHANTIAVYGGSGNWVKDNYCYDTVQFGSGVYLANRFGVVGFSGTTMVSGNTLTRCGSWDNDYSLPWGGIKLGAEESNMSGTFTISNNNISNSLYSGILIIGPNSLSGATFGNININTAGTYGIEIRNNARGGATFNYVVVTGAASGGLNNAAGGNFTITKGPGNSGW